jgi:hypothetical protein
MKAARGHQMTSAGHTRGPGALINYARDGGEPIGDRHAVFSHLKTDLGEELCNRCGNIVSVRRTGRLAPHRIRGVPCITSDVRSATATHICDRCGKGVALVERDGETAWWSVPRNRWSQWCQGIDRHVPRVPTMAEMKEAGI